MLTICSVQKLVDRLAETAPDKLVCLSVLIPPNTPYAETFLEEIRSLGYYAMIRTTALGDEVVVTDMVDHGDAGPPRCAAP